MYGKKKRRLKAEVNAGSMADIAFLLLIFFLVTTTLESDKGITVKLPPYEIKPPNPPPPKNVLMVKVNAQNELMVEGMSMPISQLRKTTKEFIMNPQKRPDMPSKPTKALVSLQNDRTTKYETYISVYNELKGAYNELWDEQAQRLYNRSFDQLVVEEQRSIRATIPLVISEAEPSDFLTEL